MWYYRARGTNVYICMLGASTKAFDWVHNGKLFNLLRQRNLPPTITRLLLDIYTRQRLYASWNGEISDPFQTQNGVKDGGILSSILFCVYIDELLRCIDSSGLGCHIGHLLYAGVGFADDMGLLTPSIQALLPRQISVINVILNIRGQRPRSHRSFELFGMFKEQCVVQYF